MRAIHPENIIHFLSCFLTVNYLCSLPVMKKKLSLIVTLLFFISTTGLPISLHYCQMQDSTSLSSCEMCLTEENEPENSCCEEESDFSVQIKSDNSDQCCVTKVVDSSVKDGFLFVVNDVKIDIKNFSSFCIENTFLQTIQIGNGYFQNSDSSPPLTRNNIYLLNSVFLI